MAKASPFRLGTGIRPFPTCTSGRDLWQICPPDATGLSLPRLWHLAETMNLSKALQIQIFDFGCFVHDDAISLGGIFPQKLCKCGIRVHKTFDIHP